MKYMKYFTKPVKEAIRYHDEMPKNVEKIIESIRLYSSKGHWTFDCRIQDLAKLNSIGIDTSDIPFWILKLPKNFGIGFGFSGSHYNSIHWTWDIYIPLDSESLLYYSMIRNQSSTRSEPDEFSLEKTKYGYYIRLWWD